MFLVTVLVMNTAKKKQKLENDVFSAAGVAQKYNCALKRLDYQQEQALMSSLPIGLNQIEIKRGLTTSSVAIFIPFTTCELFQKGEALYYGLNALSNNLIMASRKALKNPKGLYCKGRFLTSKNPQAERASAAQARLNGQSHIKTAAYKGHTSMNHKQGIAQIITKEALIFYISRPKNSITEGVMPCRVA